MKTKIYLSLLFLVAFVIKVNATASLNQFAIQNPYLYNGSLGIPNPPLSAVRFNADISLSRTIYGSGAWEDVDYTATVIWVPESGDFSNAMEISAPLQIIGYDFNGGFCSKTINAVLPANLTTGRIYLKSSYYTYDQTGYKSPQPLVSYSYTSYGLAFNPNYVAPPGGGGGNGSKPAWPSPLNFTGNTVALPSQYASNLVESTTLPAVNGTRIYMSNNPVLTMGQSIYSPNGLVRLSFQTDGNIVLVSKDGSTGQDRALWSTTTNGRGASSLYFQTDANLVAYNGAHQSVWGSNVYNVNGGIDLSYIPLENQPFYYLQDDGNLVLYWPNYHPMKNYTGDVAIYVVLGAADTGGSTRTPHEGSMVHTFAGPDNPYSGPRFLAYASSFFTYYSSTRVTN